MADKKRKLTPLEYIVLGLISMEPQSGYSIINYFEGGSYSWSASPGSIYPMLKRLEKAGVIEGTLEAEYETRPRKVYSMTASGEADFDKWLRQVPKMRPFYEQKELAMMRFQFMEHRLTIAETLRWLDSYRDTVIMAEAHRRSVHDVMIEEMTAHGMMSVHQQLLLESIVMDLNTLRSWIDNARARLAMIAHQTGEFKTVVDAVQELAPQSASDSNDDS